MAFGRLGVGQTLLRSGQVTEGVASKVPLLARGPLATNPLFRHQLGAADANLRPARALLYADTAAAWAMTEAGGEFTSDHRARLGAAATWVATTAASVVDAAYGAGGGSSVYSSNPLQRRFRDVHALTQHFLSSPTPSPPPAPCSRAPRST